MGGDSLDALIDHSMLDLAPDTNGERLQHLGSCLQK